MKPTSFLFLLIAICSTASAQQQVLDSIRHQSLQRQYRVHIPPGYSSTDTLPVVLTLHGGGGNALQVQGFTQMNQFANQEDFLAVYPEGHTYIPSVDGFVWADGRGTAADANGIDDVGFIDKLLDTLQADYNVDTSMIYVCGFSNGGFMTMRIACDQPELFAAAGALGCSMDTSLFTNCSPSKAIPMMIVAGTADPEVPYEGGAMSNPNVTPIVPVDSAVQFWVDENNCQTAKPKVSVPDTVQDDSSTVELFQYTDCNCRADVRFYKVINGGHTWPGVEIPQIEPQLGETNEDIHASYELWRFFENHSQCDETTGIDKPDPDSPITIFPNPTSGHMSIESPEPIDKVTIFDRTGNQVRKIYGDAASLSGLQTGLYLIEIRLADGASVIRKILKK